MKKFAFYFFFVPILSWAQPKKLVILLAEMPPGGVCEILGPPPAGKQQIGPNFTLALGPVKLQVITTDMSCNISAVTGWEARVGVVDPDLLPFLSGDIREDKPWAACTTYQGTTSVTIQPWRATIWQQPIAPNDPGTFPKLITEYRFVVEHVVHAGQDTMLPDTSSPLDSVIPNPPYPASKLLIILPGEKHYPGDKQNWPENVGKRGIPINLWAAKFYNFWVLGTDSLYNIVWASPPQDSVFLSDSTCPTLLVPDSVDPRAALFCTPIPGPDTLVDSIAKKLYRVRWAETGKACLKAFGYYTGIQSICECINVTGDPPTPANPINVIPNPGGTPGCPEIIIRTPAQKPTKVYAKIFDSFGYLVRDFSDDIMEQMKYSPFWTLHWDLKNGEGKLVKNGVYQFIVEIIMVEKAGIWKEKIGVVW